jgi:competence protein ComEA
MTAFFKSFSPILKKINKLKIKKYLLEVILLSVAIMITIISLVIYTKNQAEEKVAPEISKASLSPKSYQEYIYIDVSGAVKKPNLYQVNYGARIKDAIDKAGGLSENADVVYFNRNFNLARIVSDQEKIYVPSISEITNGIFIQNQLLIDYATPSNNQSLNTNNQSTITNNSSLININDATVDELDQLPGIGQVIASKIIANRPYSNIDDLVTKKIVNKGALEKIKNLITL